MFITNSKIMPLIKYKRDLGELKYTEALTVLLISDEVKQTELHEYHAFSPRMDMSRAMTKALILNGYTSMKRQPWSPPLR